MNFNDHSNLRGTHAAFSASNYHWVNWDYDTMIDRYNRSYAKRIGTILHEVCEDRIRTRCKLLKSDKAYIRYELLRNYIPINVVESLDLDTLFATLYSYVNDAIGFRMIPELILHYSDRFYGTADALSFRNNKLIIFDLKTGETPAHIEQLFIYAAYFCLEYHFKPVEIDMEVRIYQSADVNIYKPDASDIIPIMETAVMFNKYLEKLED